MCSASWLPNGKEPAERLDEIRAEKDRSFLMPRAFPIGWTRRIKNVLAKARLEYLSNYWLLGSFGSIETKTHIFVGHDHVSWPMGNTVIFIESDFQRRIDHDIRSDL